MYIDDFFLAFHWSDVNSHSILYIILKQLCAAYSISFMCEKKMLQIHAYNVKYTIYIYI